MGAEAGVRRLPRRSSGQPWEAKVGSRRQLRRPGPAAAAVAAAVAAAEGEIWADKPSQVHSLKIKLNNK